MTPSVRPDHWIYVGWAYVAYGTIVLVLALAGEHGEERNPLKIFFKRISWSLERATGYPGWSMAGALSALHALGVAVVGLYWDVAYHIDFGRDEQLFTPSHTMIVLGLGGLVYAAVIAVIFATVDRTPVRLRLGGVRIPWSAVVVAGLGLGGLAGFPLDNLWHQAYGVDVTLWSASHLQMVAGGSLAPIAIWLMLREGHAEANPTPLGRGIVVLTLGAILAGLSTFQGEFDFGVPQFQVAYLPILIGVAAGFGLVLARVAVGPGGAVAAALTFLVLRGILALLVHGALNHTLPRFPLYLGAALAAEAVAWAVGTGRVGRFALLAGAAVGTVGVAADMAWVGLSGWFPGPASALDPKVLVLAPLAAVCAAGLGGALGGRAVAGEGLSAPAAAALLLGLVVALAVPVPRLVGTVDAVVRVRPVGNQALVEVQVDPPDAAERATAFGIVAWQGGGRVQAGLREVGAGRYVATRPVPVTGQWKAMVGLQRGSQVMAMPVYLPADPEIGASAVPLLPERRGRFVRNTEVLLRERHGGPAWPAVAAYSGLAMMSLGWVVLFGMCASRVGSGPGRTPAAPGPPGPVLPETEEVRLERWRAAMGAAARH